MKKISIVQVANSTRGGIWSVIQNINNFLSKDKFKSFSILLEQTKPYSLKDYFTLKKKLDNLEVDILHSHGAWYFHLIYFIKKQKRKVIISPHGAFLKETLQKGKLKKFLARHLYMKRACLNADVLHALTKQEAKAIREYGIKKSPIAIIPNGIDTQEKLIIDKELKKELLKIANKRRVFLYLSRIDPSKGIEVLLKSFEEYLKESQEAVLFIVGFGRKEYINSLKILVKEKNLEKNILFFGKVQGAQKNSFYEVSDVFVLPSFHEAFSLSVLEAFRQKLPVITTTHTPFDEIITKNAGWYIPLSKKELYLAIKEANSLSLEELKQKGLNGYRWIDEEFNIKKVTVMYEELYLWLAHKGPKPSFIIGEIDG